MEEVSVSSAGGDDRRVRKGPVIRDLVIKGADAHA